MKLYRMNLRKWRFLWFGVCVPLALCLVTMPSYTMPVILNTDIGKDIDDTWALALLLCSDELDLKLVVTEHGNTPQKATLVARFLDQVGRSDVSIGIGIETGPDTGPQAAILEVYNLNNYHGTVYQDGLAAMHDVIQSATSPVTIIALGPFDNIPVLLQRYPELTQKVNIVAMGGSIDRGYNGILSPDAEYNIRTNVKASRAMLNADWRLALAPLDVTAQFRITGLVYQKLLRSANQTLTPKNHVVSVLREHYRVWATQSKSTYVPDSHSSNLYDLIPVLMLLKPELFAVQTMNLVITDAGLTKVNPQGKPTRVALEIIDKNALIEEVITRLSQGVLNPFFPEQDRANQRKTEKRISPTLSDPLWQKP